MTSSSNIRYIPPSRPTKPTSNKIATNKQTCGSSNNQLIGPYKTKQMHPLYLFITKTTSKQNLTKKQIWPNSSSARLMCPSCTSPRSNCNLSDKVEKINKIDKLSNSIRSSFKLPLPSKQETWIWCKFVLNLLWRKQSKKRKARDMHWRLPNLTNHCPSRVFARHHTKLHVWLHSTSLLSFREPANNTPFPCMVCKQLILCDCHVVWF